MSATTGGGGEMVVGLSLHDSMSASLRLAAQEVQVFSSSIERSLMAMGRLGPAMASMGVMALAFKTSVGAAAELQQQVANLNAVLAATPAQMKQVMATSLELSRQSQFTAAQIIAAQTQLAKAGNNPGQIIDQSKNVLDLASATFSDPTQAANAYVTAMKVFQISNTESKSTVDDMARAVDSSVGKLADFQMALKQIGPVAHSANLSLHDTNVALGDLMNAGLKGDTGTALKTFLQRIQHETPQARAEVEKLGLSFYDQAGKMRPLAEIADQIRMKTATLTQEQKNFALTQIFGARGVRVADIFAEEGSGGLSKQADDMARLGTAAEIQAAKLKTLSGQAHILASSLNILAVQGGQSLLPFLQSLSGAATEAANKFSILNQHASFVPQLALGGGALFAEGLLVKRQGTNSPQALARKEELRLYQADMATYKAAQEKAVKDDIALQERLRNAQIQEKEFASKVGAVDEGQTRRITGLETELGLLRTKGALEAQIFRMEEDAAVAGMARMTSEMNTLVEEEAILERQLVTRTAMGQRTGGLAGSLTANRETQGFLRNDGDLVGLQAYKRDKAAYDAELAALQAAGNKGQPSFAKPILADYGPQQQVNRTIHDVERDLQGNPIPMTVPVKPNFLVEEEAAKKGLMGKTKGMVAGAAAGLGTMIMPVLIAITAKELIIDPLKNAIIKRLAGKDLTDLQARISANVAATDNEGNSPRALYQQQLDANDAAMREAQRILDAYNAKKPANGLWDFAKTHTGARDVLDVLNVQDSFGGTTAAEDLRAKQAQELLDQTKHGSDLIKTRMNNAPDQEVQRQTTRLLELEKAVRSGTMTAQEADRAWKNITVDMGVYGSRTIETTTYLTAMGKTQQQAARTDRPSGTRRRSGRRSGHDPTWHL
ncbi:MAG: phage tail tape measure protein [Thermomicrobia bacterium]|nr:phage tail tape measure protein [Thermomicrobia bacterium]